jgi:hypothetical protein
MPQGTDPQPEVRLLKMNGLDAKFAVLAGVDGAGTGTGRKWTDDTARFQFRVSDLSASDLYLRYAVPEVTFRQTGPVRVSIDVNGKPFDSFLRTAPGDGEFRHPADGILAKPFEPFIVSIRINPPYVAKDDNAKLGILLDEIGFVPRGGQR